MANIEERIVRMKFDNSQFAQKAKETLSSLKDLESKLKFSNKTDAFKGLTIASSKVDFSNLENGLGTVETKISALGMLGTTVMQKLSNTVVDLGSKVIRSLMAPLNQIWEGGKRRAFNIEDARFKLEGLGVTGDKLKVVWENVSAAVDGTAYSLDAAAGTAAQLAASGVKGGEDMATALRAVSGVAAVTGSSYEDIGRIFAQIAGQGRLMGQDLLQLSSRTLNAQAAIAKSIGKTEAEVKDMVSKGQIDFQTFATVMNETFGNAAMKANETVTGVYANIKSALAKIGADLITPFITNTGTEGHVSNLVELLNRVRESINLVKGAMKPLFDVIQHYGLGAIQGLTKFLERFNELTDPAKQAVEKFTKSTKKAGDTAKDTGKELEELAKAVISGEWGNGEERMNRLTEAGKDYAKVQNVVNQMLDGTYKGIEKTTEAVDEQAESVTIVTGKFIDFRESLARGFGNIIQIVAKPLAAIGEAMRKAFKIEDLIQLINIVCHAFDKITEKFVISDLFAKSLTDTLTILFSAIRIAIQPIFPLLSLAFKGIEAILWVLKQLIEIPVILITAPFRALIRISDLFASNKTLAKAVAEFQEAFSGFGRAIGVVTNGIGTFVSEFMRILGLPFKFIGDSFIKIRDIVEGGFVEGVCSVIEFFASLILKASKAVGAFADNTINKVKEWATVVGTNVKNFIDNALKPVVTWFENVTQKVQEFVNNTKNSIFGWVEATTGNFIGWVKNALEPIKAKFSEVAHVIKSWVDNTIQNIMNWITSTGPKFVEWARSVKNAITGWFGETFPKILHWTKETAKFIFGWAVATAGIIKDWVVKNYQPFLDFCHKVIDIFKDLFEKVKQRFETLKTIFLPIVTGALGLIFVAVKNFVDKIKSFFTGDKINMTNVLAKVKDVDIKKLGVEKITGVVEKFRGMNLKEAFSKGFVDVKEAINNGLHKAFGNVDLSFLDKIVAFFSNLKNTVSTMFKTHILDNAFKVFDFLKEKFGKVKEFFSNAFSNISVDGLIDFIEQLIGLATKLSRAKMLWNIGSFFGNIGKAAKNFSSVGKSFQTMFGTMNRTPKKSAIEKFQSFVESMTNCLLKVAVCVGILSMLDGASLKKAAGVIGGITTVFAGLGILLSDNKLSGKLLGDLKGLDKVGEMIDNVGSGLMKLTVPIFVLGRMNVWHIAQGLTAIVIELGILLGAFFLFKKFIGEDLSDVSANIEAIGNALLKLTVPIAVLGYLPWQKVAAGLFFVGVALAEVSIALIALSKYCGDNLENAAGAIDSLSNAMLKLMIPIALFSLFDFWRLVQGLVAVGAGLLMMTVALKYLSTKCGDNLEQAANAMVSVSKALILLMVPIIVFSMMDFASLAMGMIATGLALAGLVVALKIITSTGVSGKAAAMSLLILAGALAAITISVKLMAGVPWPDIAKGLVVFAAAVAGMVAVAYLCNGAVVGLVALGAAAIGLGAGMALGAAAIWLIVESLRNAAETTPDEARNLVAVIDAFGQELALHATDIGRNFMQALVGGLVGGIDGAVRGACQGIGNMFKGICTTAQEWWGGIQDWWNNRGKEIPEAVGEGAAANKDAAQEGVVKSLEGVDPSKGSAAVADAANSKTAEELAKGSDDISDAQAEALNNPEAGEEGAEGNAEAYTNSLGDFLSSTDLSPEMQEMFSNVDLGNIGDLMSSDLLGGITNSFNGENGLASLADNLDFSSLTSAFSTNGTDIMNSFGEALGNNSQAVNDGAQKAIEQVPEILSSNDTQIFATAQATMSQYGEGIVAGYNEGIIPKIQDSQLHLLETFTTAEPQIRDKGTTAAGEFGNGFEVGFESTIQPAINNVVTRIVACIEESSPAFTTAGLESGTNYSIGLDQASTGLATTGTGMANSVISGFQAVEGTFTTVGYNTGSTLGTGIQNGVNDSLSMITTSVTSIVNMLAGQIPNFGEVGKNAGLEYISNMNDNFKSGMTQVHRTIIDSINKLLTDTITTLQGAKSKFETSGKTDMAGFNSGLNSHKQTVINTAQSIASSVGSRLSRYMDFYRAGTACMSGFISGMNSMSGSVYQTAYNLGRRALDAAKKAVDSHSPSKEFFKLGVFNDEGYIGGMESKADEVERTSRSIGRRALDAIAQSLKGIDTSDLDIDATPVITPVVDLSNIDSAKDNINDLLALNPQSTLTLDAVFGNKLNSSNTTNVEVNVDNQEVVEALSELREDFTDLKASMRNLRVYMDSGRLVGEIMDKIDTQLGVRQTLKTRGV